MVLHCSNFRTVTAIISGVSNFSDFITFFFSIELMEEKQLLCQFKQQSTCNCVPVSRLFEKRFFELFAYLSNHSRIPAVELFLIKNTEYDVYRF